MGTAKAYRAVFALVGWGALGLQYWLMLTGNPGKSPADLTLNFFSDKTTTYRNFFRKNRSSTLEDNHLCALSTKIQDECTL